MIAIDSLSYRYLSDSVLSDISTEFKSGLITGILGPNGAGKSTLLRLIKKDIIAPSGTITVNGHAISSLSERDLASMMAWVHPDFSPAFRYTCYDIVAMGRFPYQSGWQKASEHDHSIITTAMTDTHTLEFKDRYFDTLSTGQQQRVQLAKALAQDTPILLLDEPIAHLDLGEKCAFAKCLTERLKRRPDLCIIVVSHDVQFIRSVCHEVLVLNKGKIVANGPTAETLTPDIISKTFEID